ncbi:MAG: amidohydrolase family protein [Verrucomicrobiota bacterium]
MIREVGRWSEMAGDAPAVDLGEVILLPGLVNSHCHLDYTDMAGQITPLRSFADWVKSITTLKAGWSYTEFAQSWVNGARMLLRNGVTTVADIEAVPELLPDAWEATPLRVHSFLEMTGVKSRRQPKLILDEAIATLERLRHDRSRGGLSPHAPYSTMPELLRLSAAAARERGWRLTTHVAESIQEFEMFVHGRGEMFDWLARNERDMADCGRGTPVQHLETHGLLADNLLAIHVNYLGAGDAELLARQGVSVVHCPRSHTYFQHQPFPYAELARAGVNICLGTDSLASVTRRRGEAMELNMLAEMKAFAAKEPGVAPETILRLATVNGARALGVEGHVGELVAGAAADLIAIPYGGADADADAAVIHHAGAVAASMIDGQWAIEPPAA